LRSALPGTLTILRGENLDRCYVDITEPELGATIEPRSMFMLREFALYDSMMGTGIGLFVMLMCEVCCSTNEVVKFDCAGQGICIVSVCRQCLQNGSLERWLESQLELALAFDPDLERFHPGFGMSSPGCDTPGYPKPRVQR